MNVIKNNQEGSDINNKKTKHLESLEQLESKRAKLKKKSGKAKLIGLIILFSALIGSLFGGIFGFWASKFSTNREDDYLNQKLTKNKEVDFYKDKGATSRLKVNSVREESAVIDVVEKSSPAVVSVVVTKDVPKLDDYYVDPFFDDPFFNPFGFRNVPRGELEMEKREVGGGTGFIVDVKGYIVTNKHVVSDEKADYTVITNDGEKYEAEVLARDSFMDLAFLKIDANNLPTIDLGDSDNLKIGQTIIAIGNSLGEFRNTVSKGIISGLKRNVSAGDGFGKTELLEEVIQTDAAINPGNSGGPIVNLKGQAVGVNVAMAQGAENIGFAIPINDVKKIYQSIKNTGRIVRPYVGVRYVLIDKQIKEENGLEFDYGAIVIRGSRRTELAVIPGSPADKAGLQENDIILEVDGKKITVKNDLARTVKRKSVGDEVELKIWSKGKSKLVKIVLEEVK